MLSVAQRYCAIAGRAVEIHVIAQAPAKITLRPAIGFKPGIDLPRTVVADPSACPCHRSKALVGHSEPFGRHFRWSIQKKLPFPAGAHLYPLTSEFAIKIWSLAAAMLGLCRRRAALGQS
jgi:hypothetical protein